MKKPQLLDSVCNINIESQKKANLFRILIICGVQLGVNDRQTGQINEGLVLGHL